MTSSSVTRLSSRRSIRSTLGLSLAALAILLVSTSPARAGEWSASGQVLNSNGTPAVGATVHLTTPGGNHVTTTSGTNGAYSISASDGGPQGTALLWAEKGGFSSPTQQVMDRDITGTLTLSGTP